MDTPVTIYLSDNAINSLLSTSTPQDYTLPVPRTFINMTTRILQTLVDPGDTVTIELLRNGVAIATSNYSGGGTTTGPQTVVFSQLYSPAPSGPGAGGDTFDVKVTNNTPVFGGQIDVSVVVGLS